MKAGFFFVLLLAILPASRKCLVSISIICRMTETALFNYQIHVVKF
jgi:hypothetical protein